MKRMMIVLQWTWMAMTAHAQQHAPVKWEFSAKKMAERTYEVHLTPVILPGWHIYGQSSPEGGGMPTKITFAPSPLLILDGKVKENGKLTSKYEDVFDVTVQYFEGPADFVQTVRVKGKVKTFINGSVQFMACTDEECLTPQTKTFRILLE